MKNNMAIPGPFSAKPTEPSTNIAVWLRVVLSLLILGHVLAVSVPPFAFCTSAMGPDRSPVAMALMYFFQPYVDMTFLNHGYAFFAPDPGASHLIRAHLVYGDGHTSEDLTFPNLKQQWPRLLYHRHFMLAESLSARFAPPSLPREVRPDSPSYKEWQERRKAYDALWQSFERHLVATHGARSTTLTRVEHRQPTPDEFERESMKIDDRRLYRDLSETPVVLPGIRP